MRSTGNHIRRGLGGPASGLDLGEYNSLVPGRDSNRDFSGIGVCLFRCVDIMCCGSRFKSFGLRALIMLVAYLRYTVNRVLRQSFL